jgi:hypothetical protein
MLRAISREISQEELVIFMAKRRDGPFRQFPEVPQRGRQFAICCGGWLCDLIASGLERGKNCGGRLRG